MREAHEKAGTKFIEVFVKTPLEVCEQRDIKGLYKMAREGKIKDFTGVHTPYEEPVNPEITLDTTVNSIEQSIFKVVNYLSEHVSSDSC